jgi:hypothetical protein
MARIEASCPQCGVVACRPKEFELRQIGMDVSYVFRCPKCKDLVQKPADDHAIAVLQGQGVKSRLWVAPAEMHEEREGPVLTYDDLIDFHHLLERPDWFEGLRREHSA